jgi:ribosomal protein S18 acetylase RimI-like enzyme
MMDYTIRTASEQDLPGIISLLIDDELGAERETGGDIAASYRKAFERIRADPAHDIIVMSAPGGGLLACLQLSFIPNLTYEGGLRAQVEGVRVSRAMRGRGLGRELILYAIEKASENGAVMVQLTTDKRRPEALNFYQSLGFSSSHEGLKLLLK